MVELNPLRFYSLNKIKEIINNYDWEIKEPPILNIFDTFEEIQKLFKLRNFKAYPEMIEKLKTSVKDAEVEGTHDEKFIIKLIPFSLGVAIAAHNLSLVLDEIQRL